MAAPAPLAAQLAQAMRTRLALFAAKAGYSKPLSIPEEMGFRAWCDDLAAKGLKVDRKPFNLAERPALIPVYDKIPSTRAEAHDRTLVVQKATQLGLTVWEMLACLYMALKWGPVTIGMFMPSQSLASHKSEHRFMPIVRGAPDIHREMTLRRDAGGDTKKIGEGNILTRQLHESLFLFLWTTGKVTTESTPMDITTLDEVQGMTLDQIDKVHARAGDSHVQFRLLLSTANLPDLDINAWYQRGTQEVWHTRCDACGAESDLSDPYGVFPGKSLAFNSGAYPGAPMNEWLWCCPACKARIVDPQQGRYIAQNKNPDTGVESLLLPRTISPRITPRRMIESWHRAKTADQRKSYYNRTLARPYVDANQLPVTIALCEAAAAEGGRAGVSWERKGRRGESYLMGIDQMGGWNAVIVKRRMPDGRQATVWVEAVFGEDPFARCSEIMDAMGVAVCVVEQLPNVNDARRFANKHRGRVFLAGYANLKDDFMVWGDTVSRSDRRTSEEDRTRYTVTLQQYKCMQVSLHRVRDQMCLFPPDDIEQDVQDDGVTRRVPLLREWVWPHLTKAALVVEHDAATRKPKTKVVKVGIDPHFAYANMLCDVAWARAHGTSIFIMPEGMGAVANEANTADKVQQQMPGLPSKVVAMIASASPGTCGSCTSFEDGRCVMRSFVVQPGDAACPVYDPKPA